VSIASDLAVVFADPHHSVAWVAGSASGRGVVVTREAERADDLGGTVLVRERVLRVPVAQLAALTYGSAITVAGVAYTVRDNRLGGGGHVRELVLT
jgi:hypothetical protein